MNDDSVTKFGLMILVCVLNGILWGAILPASVSTLVCFITGGLIGLFWNEIFNWLKVFLRE